MKTKCLYACAALLLGELLAAPAYANNYDSSWQSAASVCQPGSESVGSYEFSNGNFQFTGTATGTIKTRCAIVSDPHWNTMTVLFSDPDGNGAKYEIKAQLVRVEEFSGNSEIIATADRWPMP